jgi:hypothetical protein
LHATTLRYSAFLQTVVDRDQVVNLSSLDLNLHLIGSTLNISPFPFLISQDGVVILNELVQLPDTVQNYFGDIVSKKQFLTELDPKLAKDFTLGDPQCFDKFVVDKNLLSNFSVLKNFHLT